MSPPHPQDSFPTPRYLTFQGFSQRGTAQWVAPQRDSRLHIGFDYSNGDSLSGDIYISLDTVKTNAELYGATFDEELRRIIIHGLLHLCGYDHVTDELAAIMEPLEDDLLAQWEASRS